MKFADGMEAQWLAGANNNSDPYGSGIYRYAQKWAELMEAKIGGGQKLEDIADESSHEADTEGITGFMYGAAVSVLSQVWLYGERLRRWHNLATQLGNEGEKANQKDGAVLNPAILTIQ